MKLALTAAAAVAALGLAAGTASAQYPTLVPHRGHYHVVPSYAPPAYGGYGYPAYSSGGNYGGGYALPGAGFGSGYYAPTPSYGYGGYYTPSPSYGYGGGYGHHHHHHHHHGHHRR